MFSYFTFFFPNFAFLVLFFSIFHFSSRFKLSPIHSPSQWHPRRRQEPPKEQGYLVKHIKEHPGLPEPQQTRETEVKSLTSLGLIDPKHIARYNNLNSKLVVTTYYYDEDLLARVGLLDDIRWLFARGHMGQF